MHQSQTLQSQSPHTSQNNPSGSLTLSLKVCWKDHALTQVSLRVSSNTSLKSQSQVSLKNKEHIRNSSHSNVSQDLFKHISLKSQSQVSLIKVTLKYLSKVYLPKWVSLKLSLKVPLKSTSLRQMTDCNKETIALTVPKSMYHKKLPKHWFKTLQIDTKHLSKFGRSLVEVSFLTIT